MAYSNFIIIFQEKKLVFYPSFFIAKCIASLFILEINKIFSFQVGENSAKYKVLTSPTTGLKVARTDLRLLLEPNHFRDGLLIAKCIASMFTMHWQSTDISIKEESPTLASVVDHSNGAKNETEMGASTKNKVGTGFNIPATSGSTNILHAKGDNIHYNYYVLYFGSTGVPY